MSETVEQHRAESPLVVGCAVITVSDTRKPETDQGGDLLAELVVQGGHQVVDRQIIRDEPGEMSPLISFMAEREDVGAILMTGGTGISQRDQTFETVSELFTKLLPGYGELFRYLGFQQIGSASMLSRAVGGVVGNTVLLTMPGAPAAVQLAMQELVLPELGHLVREARR